MKAQQLTRAARLEYVIGALEGTLSLEKLQKAPTLSVGQADDLKVEYDRFRVWLSCCSVADGEPYANKVTVERHIQGQWVVYGTYQAS